MSGKTKIIVLKRKKLLYTGIIICVAILLLILLSTSSDSDTYKNSSKQNNEATNISTETPIANAETNTAYIPGVYTTELVLGEKSVDVEVLIDQNGISSISIPDLDSDIKTTYPLLEPTLQTLSTQIYNAQSVENITYDTQAKYTSLVLLEAIKGSLDKASVQQ